ncbi:NACHT domain-containing protein [Azospirillum sp.]|uniref:NACHT domain-containing protein n=1 Tax=Azospirillum sp. TaxID=34012 RepID=UPI002D43246C|nr:NACHT domain-containing protein [Azospirillum sp.]HYD64772.1 NACHT domain-containing protein [Azospirillum sp.]
MLKAVAGLFPTDPPAPPDEPRGRDLDTSLRRAMHGRLPGCLVPTEGHSGTLDKLVKALPAPTPGAGAEAGERRDAVSFLIEWAANPKAQPYCALLGDLGMGKTTTCVAFTDALLQARDGGGPNRPPLPIYLDLRNLGEVVGGDLTLEPILDRVLKGTWRGGQTNPGLTATEVIRLVREEGALVIFDGLDEVLVHLSPAAGQRFTRELFRILPPALLTEPGRRAGRLLISCRTHYFRTLRDQQTHLTAEGRDGIRADLYRTFILLPFTEEQIRAYLRQALPDQDPDRVLELLRSVHNLTEMAERPYTLSLLAEHIGVVERWRAEAARHRGGPLPPHGAVLAGARHRQAPADPRPQASADGALRRRAVALRPQDLEGRRGRTGADRSAARTPGHRRPLRGQGPRAAEGGPAHRHLPGSRGR